MSTAEVIPPKVVQRWSAEDYARNGRFVSELAHDVLDLLAPKRGERILDLGCGDGALTEKIAASGADVLGGDLSEERLAAAAAKGLKVQSVDGHALPFKTEFDAVFTNAALHWMRRPKLVVAGVARALKPNGRFVGEFGGHGNVWRPSPRHYGPSMRCMAAIRPGSPPGSFPRSPNIGGCLSKAASSSNPSCSCRALPRSRSACRDGSKPSVGLSSRNSRSRNGRRSWPKSSICYARRCVMPTRVDHGSHPATLFRGAERVRQGARWPRHIHARFMAEAMAYKERAGALRLTPSEGCGA